MDGRLASLVRIMNGRRSLVSHLAALELSGGVLSLWSAGGESLFAVPVGSVEARPQPRRPALHQYFFNVHADDRWWYLAGAVVAPHARSSTRALAERHDVRERAPRPAGMSEEAFLRITGNPTTHQELWAACWVQVLSGAA